MDADGQTQVKLYGNVRVDATLKVQMEAFQMQPITH